MSIQDNTATDKRDVYRKVTDAIIHSIEQGAGNWRMPWHTSGKYAFSPINVVSKKPYRGINTVCLWAAAQAKGYELGKWATRYLLTSDPDGHLAPHIERTSSFGSKVITNSQWRVPR